MRARKSLGQNFLMHAATAERIADAAELSPEATVLEIGPGTGMLTRALLARAKHVIAVEADGALIQKLEDTFSKEITTGRLTLVHGDIRAFEPSCIKGPYTLVANIPYYLTGEIMRLFLSTDHKPTSMTLLVQKEVAERVARAKKESLLSLAAKVYGTPKYRFTVPRGAFVPAPNVDSAVLSIIDIKKPFTARTSEEHFFDILRAGFAHKRKLLIRNLEAFAQKTTLAEAFAQAHIPENARAEDIDLARWKALAARL